MAAWVNAIIVDLERGLRRPSKFTPSLAKIFRVDTKTELGVVTINLYFFAGIVGLLTFSTTVDLGSKLICTLMGVGYPVYNCMNSMIQKSQVKWLPNWFGFTGFLLLELLYDIPPSLTDVYLAIKNTFLIWYFLWYAYSILCLQDHSTAIIKHDMDKKQ